MKPQFDVAVAGAGPAGTALVSALSKQGLRVAWIAPSFKEPWPNRYGVWRDELEGICTDGVYKETWASPIVATSLGIRHLEREYALVDSEALRAELLNGCHNITEFEAQVSGVEHWGFDLDQGSEVPALVCFDAMGHRTPYQNRPPVESYQTAYGILAELEGDPVESPMALMDYRHVAGEWEGPPTFLYAMQLSETRWFLEETVLVSKEPVTIGSLKARLYERLEQRGVKVNEVLHEELCVIPMGDSLPDFEAEVFPFGGAASFVHPATGYMLNTVLKRAAGVALATREFVDGPQHLPARGIQQAIWSEEQIATRRFYQFGMETLLKMDDASIAAFFEAFFSLPPKLWQGYLSDSLSSAEVAVMMLRLFAGAGLDLKSELTRSAIGAQSRQLLSAILGMKL